MNEAFLEPPKTLWHPPVTAPPMCKSADKKCYVPVKETEYLFAHPMLNSLVMDAVNELNKQHHSKPHANDQKCLNLLG